MRVVLVTLCVLLTAGQTHAQRGGATVRGVVVDAANDTPLRGVTVSAGSGDARARSMRTAPDGAFALSLTSTDKTVRIHASKAGFIEATVDVPAPTRPGVPLEVKVSIARGGAISGRILSVYGAGVPQSVPPDETASVFFLGVPVLHRVAPDGSLNRAIAPVSAMPTLVDPEARFRFGGLPAGRYMVSFESRVWPAPLPALEYTSAIVELAAAQEVTGVDVPVKIPRTPAMRSSSIGEGRGAIRGYVLDTHRAPLAGAIVTANQKGLVAVTDASGRFAFEGLTAGSFQVRASKPGFVAWPRPPAGSAAAVVSLRAGEERDGIEVTLARNGVVSGRIVDEYGDPLQNALVRLMNSQGPAANLPASADPGTSAFSDDRGVFRIAGVNPGTYVVSVAGPDAAGDANAAYPPVYYPGTRDRASAVPVIVQPESDTVVPEFSLRPVPVAQISGTALKSDGSPASGTVRLMAPDGSNDAFVARTASPGAKGEFTFAAVPAGTYVIEMSTTGSAIRELATQQVTIGDAEGPPLVLRTRPGATISGRLVLEGGEPGRPLRGYSTTSRRQSGASWQGGSSRTHSLPMFTDEPIELRDLWGVVRLQFSTSDEHWYLKSVVVNGVDVADYPFDFGWDGRTYDDVEVMFAANAASITGRIMDERGVEPVAGSVLVFPLDSSKWFTGSRWIRSGTSKADGAFTLGGLPPGEYYALAVPGLNNAARFDPIGALVPLATRIVAGPGEAPVTLRLVQP